MVTPQTQSKVAFTLSGGRLLFCISVCYYSYNGNQRHTHYVSYLHAHHLLELQDRWNVTARLAPFSTSTLFYTGLLRRVNYTSISCKVQHFLQNNRRPSCDERREVQIANCQGFPYPIYQWSSSLSKWE